MHSRSMSADPPSGGEAEPAGSFTSAPSPHVSVAVAASAAAAERAAAARDAETGRSREAAAAEFWNGIDDDSSESQMSGLSQTPSDESPPSTGRSGETWPPRTRAVPLGKHDMEPPRLITYDMEALLSRISSSTPS